MRQRITLPGGFDVRQQGVTGSNWRDFNQTVAAKANSVVPF